MRLVSRHLPRLSISHCGSLTPFFDWSAALSSGLKTARSSARRACRMARSGSVQPSSANTSPTAKSSSRPTRS